VYLLRKSSDDDKRHIKMGLLFELETLEHSVSAFETLRRCFCLRTVRQFDDQNRARRAIDFCASLLRAMLRTMFETCPRPILTLRIDWNTFGSLEGTIRL